MLEPGDDLGLAREVLSELRSKFRDYLMESTVNFNTKLKEAASFGQPITEYDPGSRGYKEDGSGAPPSG